MKAMLSSTRQWMFFWNVVLTALFGLFLFMMLDIVSAGLLTTVITVGVFFVLFGIAHYFVWGRTMAQEEIRRATPPSAATEAPFVIELNDRERAELLRLLEQSRVNASAPEIRRDLLQKVRMFGA